jgi:hypothetical protein
MLEMGATRSVQRKAGLTKGMPDAKSANTADRAEGCANEDKWRYSWRPPARPRRHLSGRYVRESVPSLNE